MGNFTKEIDKLERDLSQLIMKQDHTPSEVECIHDYAESIYYLTVTDAMKSGGYSEAGPYYRGSMDNNRGISMTAMDRDNDGIYHESSMGRMYPDYRYSRHGTREDMIQKLKVMAADASTGADRAILKECINNLER